MKLKDYNIVFSGLPIGSHAFDYAVDASFLETLFDYHDLPGLTAQVDVKLLKQNTMLEFEFTMKGKLPVECDITGKPFEQPLSNKFELVVKFGEAFNDDDDEILVLPHGEYEVNIAQYIYELIVLSIPTKFLHPDVEDGEVDEETQALLDKYQVINEDDEEDIDEEDDSDDNDDDVDPRWSKLKDLLN